MDLIAALPGETLEDFRRTLEKTVSLAPESVTVHALAIKRSSRLHEQMHVEGGGHGLTPANEAEKMTALARETLARGGWKPYYLYRQKYMAGNLENVGYARRGMACLYKHRQHGGDGQRAGAGRGGDHQMAVRPGRGASSAPRT